MAQDVTPDKTPTDKPAAPKPVQHEQKPEQPLKQIGKTQDEAREEAEDDGA